MSSTELNQFKNVINNLSRERVIDNCVIFDNNCQITIQNEQFEVPFGNDLGVALKGLTNCINTSRKMLRKAQ